MGCGDSSKRVLAVKRLATARTPDKTAIDLVGVARSAIGEADLPRTRNVCNEAGIRGRRPVSVPKDGARLDVLEGMPGR